MLYERIFQEFQSAGVRYLVVGGIAVNLHGFARATGDLDVLISFDGENIDVFLGAVKSLELQPRAPVAMGALKDEKKRQEWRQQKGMHAFTLTNVNNPMEQLDVVIPGDVDFDAMYERRTEIAAGDAVVPLIDIDDLMTLKEMSNRDRDQIDLKALKAIKELKR